MRTVSTDQTGRMPRLIWVFAGRKAHFIFSHDAAHIWVHFFQPVAIGCKTRSVGHPVDITAYSDLKGSNSVHVQWNHVNDMVRELLCITDINIEPKHDKTNKMTCALSKDSDQPGHSASRMIVFVVCFDANWWSDNEDWSDWVDALADMSICWAQVILLVLLCSGSIYTYYWLP